MTQASYLKGHLSACSAARRGPQEDKASIGQRGDEGTGASIT